MRRRRWWLGAGRWWSMMSRRRAMCSPTCWATWASPSGAWTQVPPQLPPPAEEPSPPTSALAGARILLAEDNRLNQEVALALLGEAGMQIDVVADGKAAVDRVREHDYDAVLLDMQMPVMDGLD